MRIGLFLPRMPPLKKGTEIKTTPQEQTADPDFLLRTEDHDSLSPAWILTTGDHLLKIVNRDGQFAEAPFTADPPAITRVFVPPSGTATVPAGPKTDTRWQEIYGGLGRWLGFPGRFNCQVDPGPATLTVITPKGFSATATVTVM